MKKHAKKAKEKAAPKKAAPKAAPKKKPAKKPPNKILREELPESEKREILDEIAAENDTSCVILENFSYPTGLIGYTFDEDGKMRAVYSEERIIEDLMNEGMTEEDAWDWYGTNTQRGLPYCHTDEAPPPVIIHTFN